MKHSLLCLFAFSILGSQFFASAQDSPVTDDFSGDSLGEKWSVALGTWKVQEGELFGAELESDNHAAVATYRSPHKDATVRVSFTLAGSDGFHLSFNHEKGHLYRVVVAGNSVMVRMDKDKKDPKSKPETIARETTSFEQGKTYTMTCETKGDTVSVSFDNGLTLTGSHEGLTRQKMGYRFIIRGEGVRFDDFTILHEE